MATEPWNRVCIPRPAIQCQLTVPLGDNTEKCMKTLTQNCSDVHLLLKSESMKTEIATLESMLYVYHHKLCYHKPYLALKQVQQCSRRIKAMQLEESLKEMIELCSLEPQLEGPQYCAVPSQPILELVSMKILGACKLLVRCMDCCSKAFHLCLQHLLLKEYIVLNVVLLGLLSRLRVMCRGLLKRLAALYSTHIALQKEVSDLHKTPYFKDFVFPTTIEEHIGPIFKDLFADTLKNLISKKHYGQFLSKIFDTSTQVEEDKISDEIRDAVIEDTKGTAGDMGQPIQMQRFKRGKLDTFDVKSLFLPVKASVQNGFHCQKKSRKPNKKLGLSKCRIKKECVRQLMPKIQEAEDFKTLSEHLLYAVKWCKDNRLKTEAVFFKSRYLRCNRLHHAEALGYSLTKKLQLWKKSMGHSLHQQNLKKASLKRSLRKGRFRRTWTFTVTPSQRRRGVKRKDLDRSQQSADFSPNKKVLSSSATNATLSPLTPKCQESSSKGTERCLTGTDDIDDIFSSFGF
ncbi:nucleolus and neural progenitor protein [Engystomops pustulosus]|uniref:nucleolus and neural progenitor protein n=1 Tax=Engystomops pustulosus TaxID=76066 RepID=UPI003AFA7495